MAKTETLNVLAKLAITCVGTNTHLNTWTLRLGVDSVKSNWELIIQGDRKHDIQTRDGQGNRLTEVALGLNHTLSIWLGAQFGQRYCLIGHRKQHKLIFLAWLDP